MPDHTHSPCSRRRLAVAIAGVIAAGLASRAFPGLLPSVWGHYPGDALWATMVYLGIAFLCPRLAPFRLAGLALAVSFAVEFSQLYQGAWAQVLRSTCVGHLALGAGFDWIDLVAYTIGVGVGWIGDRILFFRTATPPRGDCFLR